MCIGIPMRVIEVHGSEARCQRGDHFETIDLQLVGPVAPDSYVLTFLGAAREIIDAERAGHIELALGALAAVSNGADPAALDHAFADLIGSEPTLPPHLEEARRRGASQA